jgi:hypothetical protein
VALRKAMLPPARSGVPQFILKRGGYDPDLDLHFLLNGRFYHPILTRLQPEQLVEICENEGRRSSETVSTSAAP